MQKVLFTLFVGIGHALQALKKPTTWAVIVVIAGIWWWKSERTESAKSVNQHPPIEFAPLVATGGTATPAGTPADATSGVKASPDDDELADAIASGITDPEKLPVMSSRKLEVAVGRFHKDNLRLPNDADELIAKKYLVGVPPPPEGKRYVLDLSPIQMRLVKR